MRHSNYLFISAICILMLNACKHSHDDSHEHHDHDAKIALLISNEKYEIWAEADPFALENASEIKVHVTDLKDFKPVKAISIVATLRVGDKSITQTQENPVSPGIYVFELQPEKAGEGTLSFDIQTAEGTTRMDAPTVTVFEDLHEAQHAVGDEEAEDHTNVIAFSKEQSWKIDFATHLPIRQEFGQVIKTTAQIQSSQGDEQIVSARIGGIVLMEKNDMVEGKSTSAGQTLFTVSGAGLADNNVNVRLIETQSDYLRAKADYERAQELVKDKIVSDKEFLQIKGAYETNKAMYDNLHKNFSGSGQQVTSPGNGFIKQLFVSNGQYVNAGQPLVSISKNKTLLLRADVQAKYASLLPFVSSANIRSMDKETTYTLEALNGKFLSFGRSLTEDNYLIPVTFQIDNKAGFIPGGFVDIFIRTKTDHPVLTVPNDALVEDQGAFFIFVQLTPEEFEKREVKTGMTDGIATEIISGLSDTERLVTKGAISVKLAQASGALDPHAGHVH